MAKRPNKPAQFTPTTRARFIAALSEGLSITAAAERAGFDRRWAYEKRGRDAGFAAEWDAAIEAGTDKLEDEARRRAADGTLKPVFQGGAQVGEIREYSDTLMVFLLKGRRPDKYRESSKLEVSGTLSLEQLVAASQTDPKP